jgi:hypothetical protein
MIYPASKILEKANKNSRIKFLPALIYKDAVDNIIQLIRKNYICIISFDLGSKKKRL